MFQRDLLPKVQLMLSMSITLFNSLMQEAAILASHRAHKCKQWHLPSCSPSLPEGTLPHTGNGLPLCVWTLSYSHLLVVCVPDLVTCHFPSGSQSPLMMCATSGLRLRDILS